MKQILMDGFQWYFRYFLGRRSSDEERQVSRWKKIVSRFKGKLVKKIKDSGGKFDDYSQCHLKLDTFSCIGVMN